MPKDIPEIEIKETEVIKSETLDKKEEYYKVPFQTDVDISGKDKKKVGEKIFEAIDKSIKESSEFFNLLIELDDVYHQKADEKSTPWRDASNTFLPIACTRLNGIVNKVAQAISEFLPIFTCRSEVLGDEKTEAIEKLIQRILDKDLDFRMALESILHNAGKQRSAITTLTRDKDITRRRGIEVYEDLVDEQGNLVDSAYDQFKAIYPNAKTAKVSDEEYRKIIKNLKNYGKDKIQVEYNHTKEYNKLEIIERSDFILCPSDAPSIDRAYGKFYRVYITEQDLLKGVEKGIYNEEDVDLLIEKKGDRTNKSNIDSNTSESTASVQQISGIHTEEVTGRESFCGMWKYDLDGDGIDEDVLVTIDYESKIILRMDAYPYWSNDPFFYQIKMKNVPNRFDGESIVERLAPINYEMNIQHNQRVDAWTQIISKIWLKNANADLSPDPTHRSDGIEPGQVIEVDGVPIDQALRELITMPTAVPNFMNEENLLSRYADDAVGYSTLMTGRESPSDPNAPASKTIALLRESNIHISSYIRSIKDGLNKLGYGLLWLEYQFGPDEYDIDGTILKKQDINPDTMDLDLRVSESAMNRALEQQEAVYMAQTIMSLFPFVQQNPLAQQELAKNIMQSFDTDVKTDLVTMTQEELVELLTQQIEQTQQQQQEEQMNEMNSQIEKQTAKMNPMEVEQAMSELERERNGQ